MHYWYIGFLKKIWYPMVFLCREVRSVISLNLSGVTLLYQYSDLGVYRIISACITRSACTGYVPISAEHQAAVIAFK